jgi:prolyl-tRNA synthetase
VEKGTVALARRDIPGKAGKSFVPQTRLSAQVAEALKTIQASLLERATAFRDAHIYYPQSYADLAGAVDQGWAFSWWCGNAECEAKVKEDVRATTRCMPLNQPGGEGRCIVCGEPAQRKVYFARAY